MSKMSQVTEIVKCRRCGRTLRSDKSIANGIGRACAKHERQQAIVDTFPVAQVEQAQEIIDLGAYLDRGKFFTIVASDGVTQYGATTADCTCKAALYGRMCYHRVAVMLLTA